ncbi:hypothetical protein QF037_006059 [Streptomyces canus]|uniref:hypothetical protein n=1 Tax=Streptomyces canus TaxID=58343 RepID=UPI00277EEA71|nr:hypothetical protein [Streptomyces canus]MDQ0601714.1 hypothetical protein [Streptomyces canus]
MFFKNKYCPGCKKYNQVYRMLDAGERAKAKEKHCGRTDLWRCTAEGCRWYQPVHNQGDGDLLPEELRIPAADPNE